MILRPGDEPIPGYQLERFLGKGQFGQVWQAKSPGRASVALKFLDLSGKQGRKEFRAIQRIKQIRHAHLMPIIALWLLDDNGRVMTDAALEGIGEESAIAETMVVSVKDTELERPSTLVVAQLLGDKTLGDRLQECLESTGEGIPVKELLTYVEEAARGIDFLNLGQHDLGGGLSSVHHCDIKPANILLLGDSVLITDYGLARVLADSSTGARATGMVGSPAYMAPECIAMKPGPASDQYSLAVSYIELRTGRLPFQSEAFADVLDSHRQGRLDLSRLPAAERKVIQRATAVDPAQRYPSASEMAEALRRAALGTSAPAKARTRHVIALAAMSVIALIAVGALLVSIFAPPDTVTVATKRFQLQVTPFDALLILDDQQQPLASDGRYTIERAATDDLRILATKEPEYNMYQVVQSLASLSEQDVIKIELTPRPEYYAQQAHQAYAEGNPDQAIQLYARAIQYDSTLAYQRIPSAAKRFAFQEDGQLNQSHTTPDRRHLITVGGNGVLRVWPLEGALDGTASQVVGKFSLAHGGWEIVSSQRWAVVTDDGQALILDLAASGSDRQVRTLKFPTGAVQAAISPDQKWLVTSSKAPLVETSSSEIPMDPPTILHRWDLDAPDIQASKVELGRHEYGISQLTISPHDSSIYAGSWGKLLLRFSMDQTDQSGDVIARHTGDVKCVVAAPTFLAFGGEGVLKRDPTSPDDDSGKHVASILRPGSSVTELGESHRATIEFMATCPEQRLLVTADDEMIHVWDTQALDEQPTVLYSPRAAIVETAAFSPDGQWIVTGKWDGSVELWDFRNSGSLEPLLLSEGLGTVTSVTITRDGQWIVACATDGVSIWSFPRCVLVKRGCDHQGVPVQPAPGTVPSDPNDDADNVEA